MWTAEHVTHDTKLVVTHISVHFPSQVPLRNERRTLLSIKIWNSCGSRSAVTVLRLDTSKYIHFCHLLFTVCVGRRWTVSPVLGWHLNSHRERGTLLPALHIAGAQGCSQTSPCCSNGAWLQIEYCLLRVSVPPRRANWRQTLPRRGPSLTSSLT